MQTRVLGMHQGCGGVVTYSSTATRGWRSCDRCKQSSMKGDSLEVQRVREVEQVEVKLGGRVRLFDVEGHVEKVRMEAADDEFGPGYEDVFVADKVLEWPEGDGDPAEVTLDEFDHKAVQIAAAEKLWGEEQARDEARRESMGGW
jgi:hypothetical protein